MHRSGLSASMDAMNSSPLAESGVRIGILSPDLDVSKQTADGISSFFFPKLLKDEKKKKNK